MITRIDYNWRPVSDGEISGDDFELFQVGVNDVSEIEEHRAAGEGDKWFYDINFTDGRTERIFNPNKIYFNKK